jgi:hypothetical protein
MMILYRTSSSSTSKEDDSSVKNHTNFVFRATQKLEMDLDVAIFFCFLMPLEQKYTGKDIYGQLSQEDKKGRQTCCDSSTSITTTTSTTNYY